MRNLLCVCAVLVLTGIIMAAGCTGTSTGTVTSPGTTGTTQSTPIATTAVLVTTTVQSSGTAIIDERINLMSGYTTTYQKYSFADFGYEYLYPDDTFRISINSDKPVNVIVIDKSDEMKFQNVIPEWNTVLKKNQWDYSPVVPAFSQSEILKKDMTFTVEDKAAYFLIIDPRFSSEKTWQGTKHEEVHVDVKVTKI